jgi:hypothetical protein
MLTGFFLLFLSFDLILPAALKSFLRVNLGLAEMTMSGGFCLDVVFVVLSGEPADGDFCAGEADCLLELHLAFLSPAGPIPAHSNF